jgi:hypothetical protein
MSKNLWNTIQIMVPAEMFQLTKTGKLSAKQTLTKNNAIAKNKNMGASIKLLTHDSNAIKIVSNGELKTLPEKAPPKARKKAVAKKEPVKKAKKEPVKKKSAAEKPETSKTVEIKLPSTSVKRLAPANKDLEIIDSVIKTWADPSFPGEVKKLFYEHSEFRKKMENLDAKIDKGIYISAPHLFGIFGREFNDTLVNTLSAEKVIKGLDEFGSDIPNYVPIHRSEIPIKSGWMTKKNADKLRKYVANMD